MIGVRWIIRCVCVFYTLGVHCHDDIPDSYVEKQRYDGWYNNLAHPNWGSAESVLTRFCISVCKLHVVFITFIDCK
ncbi:hypothetical protein Pmani_014125 [Petrolisthes manimaculis]|uniref:Secreted protein n=1 Tax=Petrolisthes manimaculis TaxID=1843537 RepID=A0AAE1UDE3_9EUCA|nr:hypothetical protein Pmani_014125 [Petrolisthes manimaculis]